MVASRSAMFLNLFHFSEPVHSFHFSDLEQMVLASGVGERLLMACLLEGAIGMEREYHKLRQHKVLVATLRGSPVIGQLRTCHDAEDE
jgi:hypothetical protein